MAREPDNLALDRSVTRSNKTTRRRWKRIAGVVFLVCSATAVVSLLLEPVYLGTMTIEAGIIGIEDNGRLIRNDTMSNLAAKISRGTFNDYIFNDLGLDSRERSYVEFKVRTRMTDDLRQGVGGGSITVSCQGPNPDFVRRMLSSLKDGIKEKKARSFAYARYNVDLEIAEFESRIRTRDTQIMEGKHLLEHYRNQIADDTAEAECLDRENRDAEEIIKMASEDIDRLSVSLKEIRAEMENARDEGDRGNGESTIQYYADLLEALRWMQNLTSELSEQRFLLVENRALVEKNTAAIDRYMKRISAKRKLLEETRNLVNTTYPQKKKAYRMEIAKNERKKARLTNLKVIAEPTASHSPVFPKKKKMVLISFFLSITLIALYIHLGETIQPYFTSAD